MRIVETGFGIEISVNGSPVQMGIGDSLDVALPSGKKLRYELIDPNSDPEIEPRGRSWHETAQWPDEIDEVKP